MGLQQERALRADGRRRLKGVAGMMKAKQAWYSKACPYMLIVQLADGSKWWCRMIPARHLTEQDLEPLPRSYHCIRDYELSAIEARVMYGLETEAETA